VLSETDQALSSSFAATVENSIIGHANLFVRRFITPDSPQGYKIGLIGNVATDESWRGRGVMRKLFEEIRHQMTHEDLSLVMLWSDLHEFYQKLGFTSLGQEHHYHLLRAACGHRDSADYRLIPPGTASPDLASTLLRMRHKTHGHLERSVTEFQKLLTIPETYLFVEMNSANPAAFAIVGKGADLVGVIHEWGFNHKSEDGILPLAGAIMDAAGMDEIILLAPRSLDGRLRLSLDQASAKVETCPMALGMKNPHHPHANAAWDALSQGFLWGLDSI